jgi:hypothetical protein
MQYFDDILKVVCKAYLNSTPLKRPFSVDILYDKLSRLSHEFIDIMITSRDTTKFNTWS